MARRNRLDITHAHTIHRVTLHTEHTDAELTCNQLTDQFDPTVRKRVDIIGRLLRVVQTDDLTDDGNQIVHTEDTVLCSVCDLKTKALIHLVTTDTAVVETFEIEEHPLDHLAGVIDCGKIPRAQTAIYFDQCFV